MPGYLLRDGSTTTDRRLDRIPQDDPRSLDRYPIAELLAAAPPAPPRSRSWRAGPVLDQGSEGACVGFACAAEAAADPGPRPDPADLDRLARFVYRRAQQLDPWPDDVPYEGTSVLAGGAAMVELGYADEYRWAADVDELAATLTRSTAAGRQAGALYGPAVVGVEWRDGMYATRPTRGGEHRVDVSGRVVGGHAIVVRGVLLVAARYGFTRRAFRWRNSWGASYGRAGDALIDEDDLAAILGPSPEIMVPVTRRRPAT